MDKLVSIKIVRDDNKSFVIGNNEEWRFTKKKGMDGFGSFTSKINYIDNATTDGGMITSTRMSDADRTIQFAYIKPALNDIARRRVTAFFNSKSTYRVYVTYLGRTRWAEGKIKKCVVGTETTPDKLLKVSVTFLFPNPYWKSYDNFGKDIAEVQPMIGFPFMVRPNQLTGGKYNFAKMVILGNDGDVETFCRAVFEANGNVLNPQLIINGEYVRLIDELVKGDVIEMDFTATPPTVKKNGVNFIGHCDRTSAFDAMVLGIGDTKVQFDADNGSDLLVVNIYYNKLYTTV